jgi:hypothetical protein
MMKSMTKVMLILLVGLGWLLPAQAQEEENEGIARLGLITPKDGHDDALIKAITDYHHWIANFEGHHVYFWYEILTGPDTGKYIARTAGHNWADFDAEYDWQKESGEVFKTNVLPHIENVEIWFTREWSDFSHWPESFDGYTHYHVETWYVRSGQYRAFREGLKKITDSLKAGDFPGYWGVFSVESGGHGNQMELVTANRGWSDMSEKNPSFYEVMSKALGGEEALNAFMSDWGSTFKAGESRMVKLMPEASDYGSD